MEIVVTGASGWLGRGACTRLEDRGWTVVGVSRDPDQAHRRFPQRLWIGLGPELEEAVARAGAVLNLAGRNVLEQSWTHEFVEAMRSSRVELTERIVSALGGAARDTVLVNASGYPVCGDTGDHEVDETHPASRDLVVGAIDADWEEAAQPATRSGRLALARIGIVLGEDGGAFPVLRQPFDQGAGVVLGSGAQWMPWIHYTDAVRLLVEMVDSPAYTGVVDVVAPGAARHEDFAGALAAALGVPCTTRVPAEQVQTSLGGAAELLLPSFRMRPAVAQRAGFDFGYPTIRAAIADLTHTTQPADATASLTSLS
ncbi:TIGR01777 family oxidoreductase [Actinomycetospora chiangmaiensis]|uniref:TIGR01777 family oxidoreductase n=1 Tax=Actinomycetospora chiangmaiensis TaxID=402650 RepID=UPI0003739BB7|nr:TIGR01777 family oxidoreductase [Actinomycetospora chiangmaiensis]